MAKINQNSLSLVIPVYNNQATLIDQINKCVKILENLKLTYEIIICDDKSRDKSLLLLQRFLKNPKFKIINHKINQGISTTIKELYLQAKNSYLVLYSADGDWDPTDISKLVKTALAKNADIVIGKRNRRNDNLYRFIVSLIYNTLTFLLFGVKTYDAGSIKIIKNDLLKKIPLSSTTPFFEAELIIKASKSGAKILTIPISYKKIYSHQGHGGNFSLVIATLLEMLKFFILFSLRFVII